MHKLFHVSEETEITVLHNSNCNDYYVDRGRIIRELATNEKTLLACKIKPGNDLG